MPEIHHGNIFSMGFQASSFFSTVTPGQLPTYWLEPVSSLNSVVFPQFGFPASAYTCLLIVIEASLLVISYYAVSYPGGVSCISTVISLASDRRMLSSYPRTLISSGSPIGAALRRITVAPGVIPISMIRRRSAPAQPSPRHHGRFSYGHVIYRFFQSNSPVLPPFIYIKFSTRAITRQREKQHLLTLLYHR